MNRSRHALLYSNLILNYVFKLYILIYKHMSHYRSLKAKNKNKERFHWVHSWQDSKSCLWDDFVYTLSWGGGGVFNRFRKLIESYIKKALNFVILKFSHIKLIIHIPTNISQNFLKLSKGNYLAWVCHVCTIYIFRSRKSLYISKFIKSDCIWTITSIYLTDVYKLYLLLCYNFHVRFICYPSLVVYRNF